MAFTMETNLVLPGAAAKLQAPPLQPGAPDQGQAGRSDAPAEEPMLSATIVKSWISGGYAGTGRERVRIDATYPVTKDPKTGMISLGSDRFSLAFTDLDNNTVSTIDDYAFSNLDWTDIPGPGAGGTFNLHGRVKIDILSSGKLMRVMFTTGAGISVKDIGYIFALDIPPDTKFSVQPPPPPPMQ